MTYRHILFTVLLTISAVGCDRSREDYLTADGNVHAEEKQLEQLQGQRLAIDRKLHDATIDLERAKSTAYSSRELLKSRKPFDEAGAKAFAAEIAAEEIKIKETLERDTKALTEQIATLRKSDTDVQAQIQAQTAVVNEARKKRDALTPK